MESSSSGSSRRARTPGNGSLVPSCMVDRCTVDLSNCRDYHRRHKVCELHSKTSMVFIKGHEQRFCQQCSRFHSLGEFDEGKRSCRKRLEGHNRRRRKPQRDSISVNSSRLFTSMQGTRYIHFGASQILSASATSQPLAGIVNADRASNMVDSCSSQEMFSDGLNRGVDSNRALSLLSSPPAETREIHMAQSLMSSINYSCTGVETEPVGSVLVSDSRNANLSGQNMSHVLLDGTFTTGSQPTLSFLWE